MAVKPVCVVVEENKIMAMRQTITLQPIFSSVSVKKKKCYDLSCVTLLCGLSGSHMLVFCSVFHFHLPLGWTGEKVCLAGDSAGGNLCVTTSMRAAAFGVRMPDGIVAAYPATLLTAYASPSRLLTLMDPLLPLSVLSRCLSAYAGQCVCVLVCVQAGVYIYACVLFFFLPKKSIRHSFLAEEFEI